MSKVPWSTFARCCAFLVMVDIRPSIEIDGRHSTIDWSRVKFEVYLSNDDFRPRHSSSRAQGQNREVPYGSSPTFPFRPRPANTSNVPAPTPVAKLGKT